MFQHHQGGNAKMKSTDIKTILVQERALNDGDMCQVYEVGKYDVSCVARASLLATISG